MSQVPLAPPPPTGQPIDGWLFLLWQRVTAAGQILWSSITPSTSADVAAVVTDETGSPGSLVFSGNPTLDGVEINGLLYQGDTTAPSGATLLGGMFSTNTASGAGVIVRKSISAAGNTASINLLRSRGTNALPEALVNGDSLSNSVNLGFDGTNYSLSSFWIARVDGTVSTGVVPGSQFIYTTNSSGTTLEAFGVSSSQVITLGGATTAPALKVTPVASQARWIEVTGATSGGNPKLNTSAGSLELGSTGSTAITINSSGNVGIGAAPISTVPLLIYHATTANLTVQGDASTVLQFQRFSNDATSAAINFKKARGTTASQSAVASGDELGIINFSGWGGSNLAQGVYIQAFVDTYVSTSDVSTYLTFSTRAAATGAPVEALRITSAQRVVAANTIATAGYTVATLPAGTVGDRAYVTDALAPAYGVAVAGGGAVTIPVFYNGAAWICA